MSITGSPSNPGDQGPHDENRATPAEPPPDNWNAEFTAIVSGISGAMHWEVSTNELDAEASSTGSSDVPAPHSIPRAPNSIWNNPVPDTADDRQLRRELRRQEREEGLAAFHAAQAEVEAARAADTEHFVPPVPPPFPRPRRHTVGGLALMLAGVLLLIWPDLLPASLELALVLALGLIVGGVALIMAGIRLYRRHPSEGSDDGAQL